MGKIHDSGGRASSEVQVRFPLLDIIVFIAPIRVTFWVQIRSMFKL